VPRTPHETSIFTNLSPWSVTARKDGHGGGDPRARGSEKSRCLILSRERAVSRRPSSAPCRILSRAQIGPYGQDTFHHHLLQLKRLDGLVAPLRRHGQPGPSRSVHVLSRWGGGPVSGTIRRWVGSASQTKTNNLRCGRQAEGCDLWAGNPGQCGHKGDGESRLTTDGTIQLRRRTE
jgi:hypothetical protein